MSEAPATNPLLRPTSAFPFEQFNPAQVEPAIAQLLAEARAAIEAIAAAHEVPDVTPTWDSTLGALDAATLPLDWAGTLVSHLDSVCASEALQSAYAAVRPEIGAFYADIPLHEGLYAAIHRFSETDEARALDPVRARALTQTLDDFHRHGARLGDEDKATLVEVGRELSTLTHKFAQNVLEATTSFSLVLDDAARLEGVPAHVQEAAARAAKSDGVSGFKLTLHAPCVIPVLTYAEDRSLRAELWRAYNRRATSGAHDNAPLIRRILELRAQRAALLGFQDFSDLTLEDRMARTGAQAASFVADLETRSGDCFAREREALLSFARDDAADPALELEPWDVSFYAERLRRHRYDFDGEALRPYFALPSVLQGMFDLVERLYGVTVHPCESLRAWHPSVRTFELRDGDGDRPRVLGRFFADLHPRDEKRGGAWMHGLSLRGDFPDEDGGHLGLIAANVTEGTADRPALLDHQEVETLFHEFGHLMHHLLTEVDVRSLAGTNVAWDFVELPSQIMENWCWHRDGLSAFARHFETGAPIPDDMFERLLASRTFRGASAMMRQLGFATLDLQLHRDPETASLSPAALLQRCREVLGRFSTAPLPEDEAMICAFSHLFSSPTGYAAGYYSYKWAEVLDADAFSVFEEQGVFSREAGTRFRATILARGDAAPPAQLFEDFLGRAPDTAALLRRAGIEASP